MHLLWSSFYFPNQGAKLVHLIESCMCESFNQFYVLTLYCLLLGFRVMRFLLLLLERDNQHCYYESFKTFVVAMSLVLYSPSLSVSVVMRGWLSLIIMSDEQFYISKGDPMYKLGTRAQGRMSKNDIKPLIAPHFWLGTSAFASSMNVRSQI